MSSNQIVREFYRKTKLIHKNQVKTIWEATHIYTGDVVIAKMQSLNEQANQRTLLHQGKFLQTCQGSPGIPFLFWCGKDDALKEAILIEQKLGKTLKHILAESETRTVSLKSAIMVGIQLIKVISCYHEKGYIHRNINLDTIQMGVGSKCDKVFINDFIQSRSFYKKGTLQHIDMKEGIKLKRANEFMSIDVLKGKEPSRKDDLEAIILVLIHLLKGGLPWSKVWEEKSKHSKIFSYSEKDQYVKLKSQQRIKIPRQEKSQIRNFKNFVENYKKGSKKGFCEVKPYDDQLDQEKKPVYEELIKQQNFKNSKLEIRIESTIKTMELFSPSSLCHCLPKEIQEILSDIQSLEFNSKPNYLFYIQKLNAILIKNDLQNDGIYDWMRHKTLAQSSNKGGLSVKHYEWLISGDPNKSKLYQFQDEPELIALYEKMAPFIEIDKLVKY